MIITYTFGFDERFAFRSLLRRGLGGSDKVAVLVPSNRPDEKSENALSSLDNFVKRYVNGEGVMRYEIEIDDFYVAVTIIAGLFRSWAERPIILNLSGGMRLLIVETLVAAVYCGIPIKVEMETEDGKTFTEFETPDLLPVRLDELDIEILKTLSNVKLTLKFLAEALQVAKPTAWRHVKKLQELG
jgi:CRISPR-associated protein Csa3